MHCVRCAALLVHAARRLNSPRGACPSSSSRRPPSHAPPAQVHRCVLNVASDFYTGVQAALIHKSGAPAWVPNSLREARAGCRRSGSTRVCAAGGGCMRPWLAAAATTAARLNCALRPASNPIPRMKSAPLLLFQSRSVPTHTSTASSRRCSRSRSCSCRARRRRQRRWGTAAAAAAAATRGCDACVISAESVCGMHAVRSSLPVD